jgi:putative ABC transport system permease protein
VRPEAPVNPEQGEECIPVVYVSPGYLRALGIPVRGNEPAWPALEAGSRNAVISAGLARRFWGDVLAIDQHLVVGGVEPPYRIVGIADDIRNDRLDALPVAVAYVPLLPEPQPGLVHNAPAVFVRTSLRDPMTLVPAIRHALAELDAGVPLNRPQSMSTIVAKSMGRLTFMATLLGVAALMALIVGTVGIYGVVSYTVSQRRTEIGVRVALGAHGTQVRRMVIAETLRVTLFGVLAGLLLAVPLGRTIESLLYGVSPADPIVLGGVAAVLLLVAAAAGWVPATRALRVDPLEALRSG